MRKSTDLRLAMAMMCFAIMAINSNPALAAPPEGKGKKDQYNCVQVYDSSDPRQYLGILLSMKDAPHLAEIFIPSLNVATVIVKPDSSEPQGTGRLIRKWDIYFQSSDCDNSIDPAYFPGGDATNRNMLYRQHRGGDTPQRYFYGVEPEMMDVTVSSRWDGEGKCIPYPYVIDAYQAIEVPKEDIPFTLPVTLPLQFEAQ